jgi:hypothetical protein
MSSSLDAAETRTPSSDPRSAIRSSVVSAARVRSRASASTVDGEASTSSAAGQVSAATVTRTPRGFRGLPAPGRRPPQLDDFSLNLNFLFSPGKIFSARNETAGFSAIASPFVKAPCLVY